jgi:hypothetical protein
MGALGIVDKKRVDLLIQYVMAAAGREGYDRRQLGPIHILKYLYIADLAHAAAHAGQTFTGLPWTFYKFGPWALEAHQRIAPVVTDMGADEKVYPSRYENDAVRWTLRDDTLCDELEPELPHEVCSAVKRAVHEFGSDTHGLLHFIYATAPMLRAAPGELLDFRFAVAESADEPPAQEIPPSAPVKISERARRRRKEALADLKRRVRVRLDSSLDARKMVVPPPPRYDEVFLEGMKWLDELAGEPIESCSGEIVISDDIWKSRSRSDPGVS